jgi:hypothetical protein
VIVTLNVKQTKWEPLARKPSSSWEWRNENAGHVLRTESTNWNLPWGRRGRKNMKCERELSISDEDAMKTSRNFLRASHVSRMR